MPLLQEAFPYSQQLWPPSESFYFHFFFDSPPHRELLPHWCSPGPSPKQGSWAEFNAYCGIHVPHHLLQKALVAYMSYITSFRKLFLLQPVGCSTSEPSWHCVPPPGASFWGNGVHNHLCSNPPMPAYSVSFTDKGNCRPERWNNLPKVTQLKRGGARSATWVYLDPKPPSFPLTSYKVPGRPWKRYRS